VEYCGKGVCLKIGYLDDLIIIPAAIWFTVWLMPEEILGELRNEGTIRLTAQRARLVEVIPNKVRFHITKNSVLSIVAL